jgi:UDP-N-acetylmuramoyl-L-alanyl-D-glutamate--2,6-diaminopimelate ligase
MDDFSFILKIKGVTADSRAVKQGWLFAALPGVHHDGYDFIGQAIKNGASHILTEKETQVTDKITLIKSDNARRDYALACAAFYKDQPENIIAVTGTNGKTSVADFVRQILELMSHKAASIGTLGLKAKGMDAVETLTTPDPAKLHGLLADLKKHGFNHLVMEASSHGLSQYRLDRVRLKIAAFTNLSQDHLDYHKTMDNYFEAKHRLFTEILPHNGLAVINSDDDWGRKITHLNCLTYGQKDNADICLISQKPHGSGQDIEVGYEGQTYAVTLPLIGLFQAYNVLCAVGCCLALGLEFDEIWKVIPLLKGVSGRVELAANYQNRAAYIDYAHTPDALEKLLIALRPHVEGKLICVFGAGGDRDKGKRPLMGEAAAKYADKVIVTDDNPRGEDPAVIRRDIMVTCPNALEISNRAQAIKTAVEIMETGDVMAVTGKGHEEGQIVGNKIIPFNDLKETVKAMKELYI